mgnify:CR=1 FL=1
MIKGQQMVVAHPVAVCVRRTTDVDNDNGEGEI